MTGLRLSTVVLGNPLADFQKTKLHNVLVTSPEIPVRLGNHFLTFLEVICSVCFMLFGVVFSIRP